MLLSEEFQRVLLSDTSCLPFGTLSNILGKQTSGSPPKQAAWQLLSGESLARSGEGCAQSDEPTTGVTWSWVVCFVPSRGRGCDCRAARLPP